jgi:uncharacterized protein (DUF433 family)/DNA-binding transcriptional MerR regulator
MQGYELIGVGLYTAGDAQRLISVPTRTLRRWLLGHRHAKGASEPLWRPAVPQTGKSLELSFADLMEARFVRAFLDAGVSLQAIRLALSRAREIFHLDHPFATQRFRTDGRTIFLDIEREASEPALLDLRRNNYAFRDMIAPSFKDIEFEAGRAARWWPAGERHGILVDPARSFGKPIDAASGVPTNVLADAFKVANSVRNVARDFDVPERSVREAIAFEERLAA